MNIGRKGKGAAQALATQACQGLRACNLLTVTTHTRGHELEGKEQNVLLSARDGVATYVSYVIIPVVHPHVCSSIASHTSPCIHFFSYSIINK
jgi:hypothetical protein